MVNVVWKKKRRNKFENRIFGIEYVSLVFFFSYYKLQLVANLVWEKPGNRRETFNVWLNRTCFSSFSFSYNKLLLGRFNWFNFVVPLEKMHTAFKSFKDTYGLLIGAISVACNVWKRCSIEATLRKKSDGEACINGWWEHRQHRIIQNSATYLCALGTDGSGATQHLFQSRRAGVINMPLELI